MSGELCSHVIRYKTRYGILRWAGVLVPWSGNQVSSDFLLKKKPKATNASFPFFVAIEESKKIFAKFSNNRATYFLYKD